MSENNYLAGEGVKMETKNQNVAGTFGKKKNSDLLSTAKVQLARESKVCVCLCNQRGFYLDVHMQSIFLIYKFSPCYMYSTGKQEKKS